jgi:hypothetical protein
MTYTPEKKQNTNTEKQITNADLANMSMEELMELQKQAQEAQAGVEREVDSKVETPKPEAKKEETKEEAGKKMSGLKKLLAVGLTATPLLLGGGVGIGKYIENNTETRNIIVERDGVKRRISIPKTEYLTDRGINHAFQFQIEKLFNETNKVFLFHKLRNDLTDVQGTKIPIDPETAQRIKDDYRKHYDIIIEEVIKNNGQPTMQEINLYNSIIEELAKPSEEWDIDLLNINAEDLAIIRAIRNKTLPDPGDNTNIVN